MTIGRWSRQYNIIDYTPANDFENDFVRRWIDEHDEILHDVHVDNGTYTFRAINSVIAGFENELYEFYSGDSHLQEMEAYFNEH